MKPELVLSIDPGRDKCGLAVVSRMEVVQKQIVSTERFTATLTGLLNSYRIDEILIGNGTGMGDVRSVVEQNASGIRTTIVEEAYSSEKARSRYFQENPPKGFKSLLPRSMLFPDSPYDDLVAVILAEDFFRNEITK